MLAPKSRKLEDSPGATRLRYIQTAPRARGARGAGLRFESGLGYVRFQEPEVLIQFAS
jgi:hypothetical protein